MTAPIGSFSSGLCTYSIAVPPGSRDIAPRSWVVEKREDVSFEERLATMTPEQRMELARDMAARLKEQVARYREIEGQASEVTPDESEDQGK